MNVFLPLIVIGVATGAVYGLAGSGLVLSYKTSGVFNFAYGAIATIAVYFYYWTHIKIGLSWQLSVALTVLGVGPVIGLAMNWMAARWATQPLIYKVVGPIGIIATVNGLGYIKDLKNCDCAAEECEKVMRHNGIYLSQWLTS